MADQDNNPEEKSSEPTENEAVLLIRIEEMIKTHISQIDNLQEEVTKRRDMVNDIFGNDEVYQQHDKVAKEAAKIRSATKAQIMKRPNVAELSAKLREMKSEQGALREGLSDYLREYQRLSGSNEIEGDDGEVREIIYTAKLRKKFQFIPK